MVQEIWQHGKATGGSESVISGRINIPTDLLRTFVAICELGSFTKTANLLDLTQPAVSAHMRRLEAMIGADLITKSLTGVVLTECGTEVLRHARRMLAINDQIVNGSSVEAEPQVVRVGIPNISAPHVLPGIAREGAAIGGQYRLQVCCDHSHGLLRSVRPGYLELVAAQFVDGTEPASAHVRPASSLVRPYARYSQAIRDLERPKLFENRASWRLLDLNWSAEVRYCSVTPNCNDRATAA